MWSGGQFVTGCPGWRCCPGGQGCLGGPGDQGCQCGPGGPGGQGVQVVQVVQVVNTVQVVNVVQVVRVFQVVSLDGMYSESIWFTWSKPSDYWEQLRCHACDRRTDTLICESRAVFCLGRIRNSSFCETTNHKQYYDPTKIRGELPLSRNVAKVLQGTFV